MKYSHRDGWELHKIRDIADVNPWKSKAVKREDNEPTSFVPMETVDEVNGKITALETRTYREVKKGYTYFENGDIIFAKITPCMQNGKSAIAENLIGGFGYGSTEFIVIRAKPGYSNKWILHFLRTAELRKDAEDHFTGSAGQQRVSTDFIGDCKIPYPVDHNKVDIHLSELNEAINRSMRMHGAAQKQEEAVNSLQNSTLSEIFPYKEGEKLPEGWKWDTLSHLSKNIQYGVSLASTKTVTNRKLLRITDIQKGSVDWPKVPYCDCSQEDSIKYELEDGDIVFARTGATTGKSFLVKNPQNSVFASYLIRVQCNGSIIPDFLYLFFSSALYWNYIGKGSRGGTLAGFNATMLGKIQVPFPISKTTQEIIIKKISGRVADIIKVSSNIQVQSEVIEALPLAILRQTFAFN